MTPISSWAQRTDEIAAALGVGAVRLVPVPAGASREAYRVETPAGAGIAFLRADPATGGVMDGSEMTLAREAEVLRRVRACGLPVPAVLATLADPAGTLLELIPGTSRPDPAAVEQAAPQYMALLARLHRLDPVDLGVAASSITAALRSDLDWWRARAATTGTLDRPLIRLALRILADSLPDDPAPARPVHGDAGPGNLMVHEGRVVALLDWELFHAGDPHEDLAWIWMRGAHTDFGDFTTRVAEYEAAAGVVVDPGRLDWQAAFVMVKSVISLWAGITAAQPGADVLGPLVAALAYDALLGSVLVRLRGGALRLLANPAGVADPAGVVEVRLVDQLAARLGETDRTTAAILDHLRRQLALEPWRTIHLAADVATRLPADPADPGGLAGLAARVDGADAEADAAELTALATVLGAAADRAVRSQPRAERLIRRAQRNGLGV
ncbi:phosphotransferase family protein [Frankia tisae]|uniref:phosphotransferase family protein n=1 Tax=Frankia tisae TaxID=2950104 RepID=UPI0021C0E26C|nr:phosphotransferase family protein [Frankia tisae]